MAAAGKIGEKRATVTVSTQYRDGRPIQTTLLIALSDQNIEVIFEDGREVARLVRTCENAAAH